MCGMVASRNRQDPELYDVTNASLHVPALRCIVHISFVYVRAEHKNQPTQYGCCDAQGSWCSEAYHIHSQEQILCDLGS